MDTTQSKPYGRLLVVDDEHDLMQALVEALELHGYDVTGLGSSRSALEALRAGSYDLLLTDLMLPGMDGIALLRAGLEIDPNLVGLIMTGQDSVPTAVKALKLGALDYVLKPFSLETILASLERALELRRVRQENLQLRETVALYALSRAMATTLDPASVAQQTAAAARQQIGADEAAVLTLGPGDDALVVAATAAEAGGDHRQALIGERVPLTEGIAPWIAQPGEAVVLGGPVDDPRFRPLFPRSDITTAIAAPMIAGGRVVGVLTANGLGPRRPFTPGQMRALSILANAGAAALENAALVERLRAGESRFRELFENASDGILMLNERGVCLGANSRLLGWLGYQASELIGSSMRTALVPEDLPALRQDFADMQAGHLVRGERRLRRKDGTWLPVELTARRVPDGTVQAIIRDITERQRAEQALRASESRYRELIEHATDAIVTVNAQGDYIEANSVLLKWLGYTREELLRLNARDVVAPDEQAKLERDFEEMRSGKFVLANQRLRRKDGTWLPVELSSRQLPDGSFQAFMRDITERQQAERALRDSEARFAALFQASPAAITLSTFDGHIVDVNAEFERVMGFTRAEVVGQRARDVGTWAVPEERERVVRLLAEHGSLAGLEVQYRRRSGEIMQALSSFEAVVLAGERYILTLALDITDRKRAEDQVRFQAGLLGAVGQAVIATDLEWKILYWNHMAEKMYGWRSDEVLGRSVSILMPVTVAIDEGMLIMNRVRAGGTWTGEFTLQRRDGTTFPALVTDTPFYDRQGALAGIIGMSTDISERKQRQRELEAISQLSAALRVALTREQIPVVILEQIGALFGAAAAALSLVDPGSGEIQVEHATGHWARWARTRAPGSEGIVGHVVKTGEPYVTGDGVHDLLFYPPEASKGIEAVAVLPLIAHGQTIGSLSAGRPAPFGEDDLRLLRSIADIAANALQRASLHEQTRQRADQLAAVNELARALAETLLLEQIYERLDAATRQLLPPVSIVAISLYDPELQTLLDVYRAQDGERLAEGRLPQAIDAPAVSAQAEVLRTRRPLIVNHGDTQLGNQSSVFAPLLAKGQAIGVLQAHRLGTAGGKAAVGKAADGFGGDDADLLATVANTAAVAIENARLFAETQRRLLRLQALRAIDLAITSSMDSHISLRVLADQAATHLGVDAVDVLLLDPQSHRLEMAAGRGFKSPPPHFSLRVDEGNAGRAFMERRLLRVPQLPGQSAHTARAPWIAAEGFVAYFGMPLLAKGLARGVLEVFHRAPLAPDAEWMDFLETLAEQAAIAVDNSGMFAELQRSNMDLELAYDTTLEGWSRALDLRDKETEGHTQRVTDVTERLARAMGLNQADLVPMRRGALLHDIGKMGIPDSILLKPGTLSEDEWAIMRKHPTYAYELLAPIAYLRTALEIPYCHHEKWDGTGYPRGLKGEQIPLAARVFAVVDVWDALRSDRPYRQAWPEEQVREHIRQLSGAHFDPRVVQAFMALPV